MGRPRTNPSFAVDCIVCGPTTTTIFRRGMCCRCYAADREPPAARFCEECGDRLVLGRLKRCEPCATRKAYDRTRAWELGITAGLYRSRIEEARVRQGGRCATCLLETTDLHYDHCHETQVFRGLLCGNCNRALGGFQDSVEILERAIAYLRLFRFQGVNHALHPGDRSD